MVVGQLGEGVDHVSAQGGVQVLGDELASTWPGGGEWYSIVRGVWSKLKTRGKKPHLFLTFRKYLV